MQQDASNKNWLRIISPCTIAALLSAIGILISIIQLESFGGWTMIGIIFLCPGFIILIALDFLIKAFTKESTLALC